MDETKQVKNLCHLDETICRGLWLLLDVRTSIDPTENENANADVNQCSYSEIMLSIILSWIDVI